MFGQLGDRFVTAAIAISTFGFLDLAILAPTRVYYAMAADGLFFPALARLHPIYRTPVVAIVVQTAWSCILTLSGTYGQLLNYVVFADWIFFGATVSTLLVFRHRFPVGKRALFLAPASDSAGPVRLDRGRDRTQRRLVRPSKRVSRRSSARDRRCGVLLV
jgi:amino acid transporter